MARSSRNKSKQGRKANNPTGYTAQRGDELIAIMAEGYSLKAAAGKMGFAYETLEAWSQQHPKFADAVERGKGLRLLKLERDLINAGDQRTVRRCIFALSQSDSPEWNERARAKAKELREEDPLTKFLRSINGKVMRPKEQSGKAVSQPSEPDVSRNSDANES